MVVVRPPLVGPARALEGVAGEAERVLLLGLDEFEETCRSVLAAADVELVRVRDVAAAIEALDDRLAQVVIASADLGGRLIAAVRARPRDRVGAHRRLRGARLRDRAAGRAGRRRRRRDARPVRARGAGRARGGGPARRSPARERGAAALAGGQPPRRRLPLRVRRGLDDAVAQRRDRGDLRLPGERLHRQRGAHLRERHPSRRPRAGGAVGDGRGRGRAAVHARVPRRPARRERALGARTRAGAGLPGTAGAGSTARSSTSPRGARPSRRCASARSSTPSWPRCAPRGRGSWRRPTAPGARSSAICTTARSSGSCRSPCGCRSG